ncbi:hypothetical protein TNCV_4288841 [Trichonephila clavipes]|nr:hypothetical protein TNCV_4288841 [Trichonephila clavipes]
MGLQTVRLTVLSYGMGGISGVTENFRPPPAKSGLGPQAIAYKRRQSGLGSSPMQINLELDSVFVQELLDSHNHELIIDELIEMHEQGIEEHESLDLVQSENRMMGQAPPRIVWIFRESPKSDIPKEKACLPSLNPLGTPTSVREKHSVPGPQRKLQRKWKVPVCWRMWENTIRSRVYFLPAGTILTASLEMAGSVQLIRYSLMMINLLLVGERPPSLVNKKEKFT